MPNFFIQTIRVGQLFIGLFFCGTALALLFWAAVGLAPWDVLSQGLMKISGLSFGTMTIILSAIVMLLWIPLRQKPGFGTIANAIFIGVFADIWLAYLPVQFMDDVGRYLVMLLGVLCFGIGSGLYIGANFGPGPRDGLMTGIHQKFGWAIWKVRTGIELSVLGVGWLLGGNVGVGTIVFSLLIGPLCQIFIPLFSFEAYQKPAAQYAPPRNENSSTPTSEIPTIG